MRLRRSRAPAPGRRSIRYAQDRRDPDLQALHQQHQSIGAGATDRQRPATDLVTIEGPDRTVLGFAQEAWLADELLASTGEDPDCGPRLPCLRIP